MKIQLHSRGKIAPPRAKALLFAAFIACALIFNAENTMAQSGQKFSTGGINLSNGEFFGTLNSYPLITKVNNTEMMRITPNGFVGIGTNNPLYRLDVEGRLHISGNIFADSSITAMHMYAIQKVTADALQVNNNAQLVGLAVFGNKITVDGNNSSISSNTGILNFQNNNLTTNGSLNAANLSLSSLQGTGKMLLQSDSAGKIIPFALPDNYGLILYGNGTWGPLPEKGPWIADSNGIYPDTTLVNKNVFVKNLYASKSVNIGTFRFKNGVLPGEHDTISAERPVVIRAAERMEFSADTLTMKNRVGIGVNKPQYALDVAGDVNASGTVYANNLYAQNSIAIGTLRISNDANQLPDNVKDSISSPYKLALVSAGREISLISDTVKVGDYSSTVRFDVNGSVRVRDVLWVETGLIVGKKFEGDKADVDTLDAKKIITQNFAAQTAEAQRIYADSAISAISKSDSAFTFKLGVAGDAKIKGNAEITGNLKVLGTLQGIADMDSLHVLNKIKVGSSIWIDGINNTNTTNNIFTDATGNPTLYIQSKTDNYNTVINANNTGKVGIGTIAPLAENYENQNALKLDVCGHARFYSPPDGLLGGTSNYLRVGYNGANAIIDNYGTGGLLINYYSGNDVVIGQYFPADHTATGTLSVLNKIGIGTAPDASNTALKLHIKGYTCTTVPCSQMQPQDEASTVMRIEDEVYGQTNRDVWWDFIVSGVNQKLFINSQSGSTLNRIMTMTETGNVGIGTTSPVQKLHVYGNVLLTGYNSSLLFGNGEEGDLGNWGIEYENDAGGLNFWMPTGSIGAEGGVINYCMFLKNDGKVSIGIDPNEEGALPDGYRLYVNDGILTERCRVAVLSSDDWQDFVFDKDYTLMPIYELENFINENKHLPNIPSATEVIKTGIDVAQMDALLLQKIEELTLYTIQLKKQIDELKKENETQKGK